MIPGPHRMKGGALLLGVTVTGRRGPFGVRGEEDEPDGERQRHATPAMASEDALPGALDREVTLRKINSPA
jgi:hypothetical protein